MAKCKNCGEGDKQWTQNEEGKWRMLNADGSAHRCMSSSGSGGGGAGATQWHREIPVAQAQQQVAASQAHPTTEEWNALWEKVNKMTETLAMQAQFYEGLVGEMQSISKSVHKTFLIADKADQFLEQARITDAKVDRLVSRFKHEEELAQQEEAYDQAKEDGTIGFG